MLQTLNRLLGIERHGQYRRQPTLVLVNGLAEQGESWFRSAPTWRRRFDVQTPGILVYDGAILQERLRQRLPISINFLTDRLSEYLDNFVQTPPYHLVGSSLGGQVVVEYAARHPERVGRVVLLCPSGMGCEENLPIAEGARHHNFQGLVESVFFDRRLASPGIVNYYERKFKSRNWRKALFQTVRSTKSHSVRDKLPLVQRPTLVICGEGDKIVDPFFVRDVVRDIPNFEFVMLPKCGHAPQLEVPEIINPMVERFLAGEDAQPAKASPTRPREASLRPALPR